MNSPCSHLSKCIETRMENMHTEVLRWKGSYENKKPLVTLEMSRAQISRP